MRVLFCLRTIFKKGWTLLTLSIILKEVQIHQVFKGIKEMTTRPIERHESLQSHHKFIVVAKKKGFSEKSKWYWKHGFKTFLANSICASVFTIATLPESIWDLISVETPESQFYGFDFEIVVE